MTSTSVLLKDSVYSGMAAAVSVKPAQVQPYPPLKSNRNPPLSYNLKITY